MAAMDEKTGFPGSGNIYGQSPYTGMAPDAPPQQPLGYGGKMSGIAAFANAFLRGAQQQQQQKYLTSERQKAEKERNFDAVMAHIDADPSITPEGKQAAWKQYLTGKFGQVNDHLNDSKDTKDHPMMNMVRGITGAVLGPNQDKKHKDLGIDVNSLLSVTTDPKYKQDPSAESAAALQKIYGGGDTAAAAAPAGQTPPAAAAPAPGQASASPLVQFAQAAAPQAAPPAANGQPPQAAAPPVAPVASGVPAVQPGAYATPAASPGIPPFLARTAPPPGTPVFTPPGSAAGPAKPGNAEQTPAAQAEPASQPTPPVPESTPAAVQKAAQKTKQSIPTTLQEFWANPEYVKIWNDLDAKLGDPSKNAHGFSAWYSTLQDAKPGVGMKALGAPYSVTEKINGVEQTRMKRQFEDVNGQLITMDLGEGKQPAQPTMKAVWVQRPGSGDPEYGFVNPKNPSGYVDAKGQPLPEGTNAIATPSEGSGMARVFTQMATSQLQREGTQNPSRDQLKARAGDLAVEYYGSAVARRQQEMAMDAELSGVPAGRGLGSTGGAPRTAPVASPTTPPPGTPPAAAAPAGTSTEKPGSSTRPTQTPPAAAVAPAPKSAGPSAPSKAQQDDMTYYLESTLGTVKGGGKGGAIRARRGEQALRAATGLDGSDLQIAVAEYQADKKALYDAVQTAGAFTRVQETLKEHGKVLEQAATAEGPGNVPIANRTWQWWQSNSGAHPELTQYKLALNAVQREYGRLMAGGVQSRAMLPVMAITAGEGVFKQDATLKDIFAAVDQAKVEANTEQKAFSNQQATIKNKMANSPIGRAFQGSAGGGGGQKVTLTITGPDGKSTTHEYSSKEEADKIRNSAPQGYTVK